MSKPIVGNAGHGQTGDLLEDLHSRLSLGAELAVTGIADNATLTALYADDAPSANLAN